LPLQVFRLWKKAPDFAPHGSYATLAHMSKAPGAPWSKPYLLVTAPIADYSIFYHRLTIDRAGALFLSYDYWSTYWFYRTDHVGSRRVLLVTKDGGRNWAFARNRDLE
jgi:hypothetical protein